MRNARQRKAIIGSCNNADRITDLPGHITDKILSYVPIKEAIQTSILSRNWRYKWVTLPNLVFDDESAEEEDHERLTKNLVCFVDRVLLLHHGPVHKFKLSHCEFEATGDIDRWILFLSRGNKIMELVLEIWKGPPYTPPSSLYSCQKLVHLELSNCVLKPAPTFNGFQSLKSLDFQNITMEESALERMVSRCPLLERLTLIAFHGINLLNINAPNLLFFDVAGKFEDVTFSGTDRLAVVLIGRCDQGTHDDHLPSGGDGNLVKFFSGLPRLQRLEMQTFFLKHLGAGNIPEKLPKPCVDLSSLSIRINFDEIGEISAVLCILKSSPNLRELEILTRETFPAQPNHHDAVDAAAGFRFDQLRLIKIVGIKGFRQELMLMRFLLGNAPALERMTVLPSCVAVGWELMKELLRLPRASTASEIMFLEPTLPGGNSVE